MLALLLALALVAAPPSATLTGRPPATVGDPWRSTLFVRNASPASVVVTATNAAGTIRGRGRRVSRGRYVRLVFLSAGRWTLTASFGGRRFALGAVVASPPEFRFSRPATMRAEPDGTLLLAEGGRQRILRIDPVSGRVTIVARDFANPFGLGRLPDGDLVVSSRESIFRLDAATGVRETLTTFADPVEGGPLAIDASGLVYVATTDHRIYRIDPATHGVTVVAGTGAGGDTGDGGAALAATMTVPHGLHVDRDGSLLIADTDNDKIRRLDLRAGVITTYARDVRGVFMLARAPDGSLLASELRSDSVLSIAADGSRTVAARGFAVPGALAFASSGTLYVVDADRLTLNRVAADGSIARVRLIPPT